MPLLTDAAQSYHQLKIVLNGLAKQDYQLVADCWNPAALTQPNSTVTTAEVARQSAKIGPIASFQPEGFMRAIAQVDGQPPLQLLNIYVTITAPTGNTHQMLFCLNPKLSPDKKKFLYAYEFLDPPFVSR